MVLKFIIVAIIIIFIGRVLEDKQWTRNRELEIKRLEGFIYLEEHPKKEKNV